MSMISSAGRRPAVVLAALMIAAACSAGVDTIVGPKMRPSEGPLADVASPSPTGVVISQVYGGGGNQNAILKNDFVELYNAGPADVSLAGWSVQYASSSGTTWQVTPLNGTIPAGHYYLVQEAAGTGGTTTLPAPDAIGAIPMSATAGKVALVTGTAGTTPTALSGPGCPFAASVADFVGFGTAANCFEGTNGTTATLSNTSAAIRRNGGLTDDNDNKNDFGTGTPTPRNTAISGQAAGPLDHVTITGGAATVSASGSVQFTAAGKDANNVGVAATITWASSDPAIATVDNTGKATGVSASVDPVTLTATAVANGITKTATTTLTVTPPAPVATVTVSPTTWTMKAGQTKTFTAAAVDENSHPAVTTITWSSSDPKIATIDATGTATGKAVGTVDIKATSANGKVGTARLTITSASNVTLSSGKTRLAFGMQTQFFFGGTDASGNPVTSVAWSTSDASVITVDDRGIVTGKKLGSAQLTATAPDGSAGSTTITVYLADGSTGVRLGHNTEFGEPKDADPNDDFIIRRAQYTVSYNPRRGGANWVSWNLDATHVGDSGRCAGTCYSADTALTNAGLPAYTTADWVSGNTYDRGHMAPSADWTSSEADNNTTFFLTNFVPQRHDMNAGPWEKLEFALRDTVGTPGAPKGREVYIIAGGIFTNGVGLGTLQNLGKIAIPDSTWKIAVITPAGTGLYPDGTLPPNSTVLAVNMPNITGIIGDGFEKYLTTVARIEKSTGYNFLALLAEATQCRVEQRNCPPTALITGVGLNGGSEGQTLAFDASTSSDPDAGDRLSYRWSIDGQSAGSEPTLGHTFTNDGAYQLRLIVADDKGAADTVTRVVNVANVPPSVGTISGAATTEGASYAATGSFTDPGDDHWTGSVDYGDGSGVQPFALHADKTFTLEHTYANNGAYTVTVRVTETEPGLASGTSTTTAVVANVAPTVSAFDDATILRGETYDAEGSFTDPGADTWTATVSYGDGSPTAALALDGKRFTLGHTYTTPGVSTVTVTVSDADGGSGTRTAQVTVLTTGAGISALASSVSAMASAGRMDGGDAKWLGNKLDVAGKELARGNVRAAVEQLGQFLDRIGAAQAAGRLSSVDAASLSAYTRRILASALRQ